MSQRIENSAPASKGNIRRARRAAVLLAVVTSAVTAALTASTSIGDALDNELRRAAVWGQARSSGVVKGGGEVRARIVLASQPLLLAASSARFRPRTRVFPSGGGRIRRDPLPITPAERRIAELNERGYERSIAGLGEGAIRTERSLDRMAAIVKDLGGRVVGKELVPAALVVRMEARGLRRIRSLLRVGSVDPAPRERRLSDVGAQAVGAPAWWAAGLTGGTGASDEVAADVAIRSEAVDATHPAFSGVTVDNDPQAAVSDHGTHTGGVIASGDEAYPGVAPGVDRLIGSAGTAYALGIEAQGEPGATDPAETISISFGSAATTDDEDDSDDVLTAVFGVGQAFAAGNENIDGSATVNNIGRNILSVGGFNDVGTVTSTDDVVLGISSRGPTPGGRKKPDLTAPGGAVIAPSAFWNSPPSNPDFTGSTGTSFSAPHVAGAMTLLEGAGIGDPMAQRAILINSARDWDGTDTGLIGWAPPQASWRPEVGWGELDLESALTERDNYRLGEVRGGEAAFYRATVPSGAKATMAFEMRGFFVGYPEPGTQTMKYTQSDLDLRQYTEDGAEVTPPMDPGHGGGPDAVDPNDTVEQVRAPAGGPQEITYKVEAASTVVGADREPFAITGASPLEELDAPHVLPRNLTTDPAGPVGCSDPVVVTASARNDSVDLDSTDAEISLDVPPGVEIVAGAPSQQLSEGTLETGTTSEDRSWTIRATSNGPKQLTVSGTGEGLGTPFTRTQSVGLTADCNPPETAIDSGPAALGNDRTPAFTFSSSEGQTYDCSIDGAPFAACASPFGPGALADGDHDFAVRARDAAGNVDPTPATFGFSVDTVPPDTAIESESPPTTRERRPRFRLTSEPGTAFECRLDASSFRPCPAEFRPDPLVDGRHLVRARAIDSAGNKDGTAAVAAIRIDRRIENAKLRVRSRRIVRRHCTLGKVVVAMAEEGKVRLRGKLTDRSMSAAVKMRRVSLDSGRTVVGIVASSRGRRLVRKADRKSRRIEVSIEARFSDLVGNHRKRSLRFRAC